MTKKIIGGVKGFRLYDNASNPLKAVNSNNGLYANARSALYALTEICKWSRIWIPSYICGTVLDPFIKAGIEINFYEVDYRLSFNLRSAPIKKGDAVLLVSYFGVPVDDLHYKVLKEKEVCIIEDLSQAMYALPNENADYSIYSLRKFLPVPDGGICVSNKRVVEWPYNTFTKDNGIEKAIEAISGRTLFDQGVSSSKDWVEAFREAEENIKTDLNKMSLFTQSQMHGAIDLGKEKNQRIRNFEYLHSKLKHISLIQDRKNGVPLGYPIIVSQRDQVRRILFRKEIYPPIHWNIDDVVPQEYADSHKLSLEIMTIPCDGCYDQDDMKKVANILLESLNR
ncbi:hypothetical protein P0Y35_14410 [Kiritimatiellaeota bacterium B1221]|nr:hypothetical protein [Kiritimatiellaeota bacterium B1221]